MGGAVRYSVIIPVWNAARTLRDCLESVLAQTCPDWECLCADDGSDDGSAGLIDGYAARDGRFRALHLPHRGPGPARNAALDAARGDYVVFADADDLLKPDALASLSDATADVVTFLPLDGRRWLRDERLRLFDLCAGNLLAWNAAYRREAIGAARFPDAPNFEDVVFGCAVFCGGVTVAAAPCWYVHRDTPGSLAHRYEWRRVAGEAKGGLEFLRLARGYIARQDGLRLRLALRLVLARKLLAHAVLHVLADAVRAALPGRRGAAAV